MTRTTTTGTTRRRAIVVAALLLTLTMPALARAEGFISPLIGFNFAGDANCPNIQGCEDKRLNFGVGLGAINAVLGFEEEFA